MPYFPGNYANKIGGFISFLSDLAGIQSIFNTSNGKTKNVKNYFDNKVKNSSKGLNQDGTPDGSIIYSNVSVDGDSVSHFRQFKDGSIDTNNVFAVKKGIFGRTKLVELPKSDVVKNIKK